MEQIRCLRYIQNPLSRIRPAGHDVRLRRYRTDRRTQDGLRGVARKDNYPANSEYGVVGTWASIDFSSAMILGFRSQT
jgi:hypothetical protein